VRTKLYIYIVITITDTSAGKLLVPAGIIRPVVSAAALTWFITYVVQFSNHIININTTVGRMIPAGTSSLPAEVSVIVITM
jgi:hypothetical protein